VQTDGDVAQHFRCAEICVGKQRLPRCRKSVVKVIAARIKTLPFLRKYGLHVCVCVQHIETVGILLLNYWCSYFTGPSDFPQKAWRGISNSDAFLSLITRRSGNKTEVTFKSNPVLFRRFLLVFLGTVVTC
jgi:hypothetical protein